MSRSGHILLNEYLVVLREAVAGEERFPLCRGIGWRLRIRADPLRLVSERLSTSPCFRMVSIRGSARVRRAREQIGETGLEPILQLNPADYTAWEIARELGQEDWETADSACRKFPKNYQVWQHRRVLLSKNVSEEGDQERTTSAALLGSQELAFLDELLQDPENAKNYHLYSHRQWLIRQPRLVSEELLWREWNITTQRELERDPLNNSAWQHRWAVLNELRRRGCFQSDRDAFAEQLAQNNSWPPIPEYIRACRALFTDKDSGEHSSRDETGESNGTSSTTWALR